MKRDAPRHARDPRPWGLRLSLYAKTMTVGIVAFLAMIVAVLWLFGIIP